MATVYKCDMCGTIGKRINNYPPMNERATYQHGKTDVAQFRLSLGSSNKSVGKDVCVSCIKKAGWDCMLEKDKPHEDQVEELLIELLAEKVAEHLA